MKTREQMSVVESSIVAEGIYSLSLRYPAGRAPKEVLPGQFVGLYPPDASALLMRPISICRWNPELRTLRLVFRAAGKGTHALSRLQLGDQVQMLGILGNGYDVEQMRGKRVLLLGGGIGIPPMVQLSASLREAGAAEITAAMGYRSSDLFLTQEFGEPADRLLIATEDGSVGTRGNVLDAVRAAGVQAEVICACGPMPMLRAVKAYAQETGAKCFLSLEERMACGVGACLGCVVKTTKVDAHSKVNNTRVCTEGPVFDAEDVQI